MAKTKKAEFQVIESDAPLTESNAPAEAAPGNGDKPIPKPGKFSLDKFKTKQAVAMANLETLLTALPHHSISQAKDFVRLHPDEETYWSPELCFVNVPIKGQKHDTLHLINDELATLYLPSKRIQRFRLALATKPYDVFFLCHIPTRNTDNSWNETNLEACEKAKALWTQATSQKEEGYERYNITSARDSEAFPEPSWPTQSLEELIGVTFAGRSIEDNNHPGLLRLVGAKLSIS